MRNLSDSEKDILAVYPMLYEIFESYLKSSDSKSTKNKTKNIMDLILGVLKESAKGADPVQVKLLLEESNTKKVIIAYKDELEQKQKEYDSLSVVRNDYLDHIAKAALVGVCNNCTKDKEEACNCELKDSLFHVNVASDEHDNPICPFKNKFENLKI